jgi:hypothetical protein
MSLGVESLKSHIGGGLQGSDKVYSCEAEVIWRQTELLTRRLGQSVTSNLHLLFRNFCVITS